MTGVVHPFAEHDIVWVLGDYLRCFNALLLLILLGVVGYIGHARWVLGQRSSTLMCLSMAFLDLGALTGGLLRLGYPPSIGLPLFTAGAVVGIANVPLLLREIQKGLWTRIDKDQNAKSAQESLDVRARLIGNFAADRRRAITPIPPLGDPAEHGHTKSPQRRDRF